LAAHSIADVVGKGTPDPAAMEGIRARLAIETEGMARVDMAWSLVRMGDRSEVEILRTLLRTGEPEDVRAEAAIGLGELGDPAEIPALEKALKDKKGLVRMRAAEAINKINGVEPS